MNIIHWTGQINSKKHTQYIGNLNKINPVLENSSLDGTKQFEKTYALYL